MSSSIVRDELARLTGDVVRVVDPPTGDLGLGSDLDCTDDLTEDMAEVPGDSPLAVAQSNYRRLTSARGSIPGSPNDGFDVIALLNKGMTRDQVTGLAGQIKSELEKDDRNQNVTVTLIPTGGSDFDLDVRGETATGPFTLIFAVVDGAAAVKEINAALS
jgi:hypothetical protein